jgi:hypothetical protein
VTTSVFLTLGAALAIAAGSPAGAAPPLAIREEAPSCFVAEAYPQLSVQITPADQVVRARVLFRTDAQLAMPPAPETESGPGSPLEWYAVALTREGESFTGVLPRPRVGIGRVRYVVEATDTAAATVRGEERSVEVIGGREACGSRKIAETLGTAEVVVEVPPGAPWTPPVPQGFSPVGAMASGNAPQVGGKGGHKGLFLALGGVAAAGVGAATLAKSPPHDPITPPIPPATGDVIIRAANPVAGSSIHVASPNLSMILRVVLPEASSSVTVDARLYRSGSPELLCGTLHGATNGGAVNEGVQVVVVGLENFSPCGLVDRVHVSVKDDKGREILATGTSARPDLSTNYFLQL